MTTQSQITLYDSVIQFITLEGNKRELKHSERQGLGVSMVMATLLRTQS